MPNMKRVAIASHVALINGKEVDGIGNVMIETMSDIPMEFTMVRHSMEGSLPSVIRRHKGKEITKETKMGVIASPAPLRYLTELLATVWHFTFRQKVDVYIGIDPLNALAAVVLKKLGRIKTCVFYTPDYSPKRFESGAMNKVYHAIDRYCVRKADEVWCVSSKIQQVRRDMGLADDKNIFVPNVPPTKFESYRSNKHDKYELITLGTVDTQLDNAGVIEAIAKLAKKYPKLSMTIVGNGPEEDNLRTLARKLGVEDRVHLVGRKPLAEALELESKAGIGLALYTGEWGFNEYGDSTKCREYFYYGLPVISTDSHATVQDIRDYKAGVVVEKGADHYVKALEEIITNYDTYAANSSKLGNAFVGIHKKEIERLSKA